MKKTYIPVIRIRVYLGPVNFLNIQHKQAIQSIYVWTLSQLNNELAGLSDDKTFLLDYYCLIVHSYPEFHSIEKVEGPYESWQNTSKLSVIQASELLKGYDSNPVFKKLIRQNLTHPKLVLG